MEISKLIDKCLFKQFNATQEKIQTLIDEMKVITSDMKKVLNESNKNIKSNNKEE